MINPLKFGWLYNRWYPDIPNEVVGKIVEYQKSGGSERGVAVDLLCANGKGTVKLAQHFDSVNGIEPTGSMSIGEAPKDVPNLKFTESDVYDLSFLSDASVDVVTCGTGFHYLETERICKELVRILKPGGVIALYTYCIGETQNEKANELLKNMWSKVMPNADENFKLLVNKYETLTNLPGFKDVERHADFKIPFNMSVGDFMNAATVAQPIEVIFKGNPSDPSISGTHQGLHHILGSCPGGDTDNPTINTEWPFVLVLARKS